MQEAEDALQGDGQLTDAVISSYFKLLSYKDEYEVARLHSDKRFIGDVRRQFGDAAKFRFHLAPPLLSSGKDARGRPRKKEFGSWMLPVFKVLAGMRGLRGTVFDVFGRTAERRMERELIVEFESLIDDLLTDLTTERLRKATDLVRLYMDIRGYGPVKEEAADKVRREVARQLAAFAAAA